MSNNDKRKKIVAKVNLTHTVTVWVNADSVDEIEEWMVQTTPEEVKEAADTFSQDYSEEIELAFDVNKSGSEPIGIVI